MRRVISLWLPRFATDRIFRRAPEWRDKPLATARAIGGRPLVVALDRNATLLGLSPGESVADVRARVPELHVATSDAVGDARALETLADWAQRYAPIVALDRQSATVAGSIGGDAGLWLDATGCAHLFGGEEAMGLDLRHRVERLGFSARVAIAGTPGAAWALARYAEAAEGVIVAEPDADRERIADLTVAALRLPAVVTSALMRLGLKRIGDLVVAPRAPLVARFGEVLARRLDQAMGMIEEPLAPLRQPPAFRTRLVFPDGIGNPDDLSLAARRLCERLSGQLDQAQQGVRRLELAAYRLDGEVGRLVVGFARPVRDPDRMFRLLRDRIAQIDPGPGVEVAILSALVTEPTIAVQTPLLAETREAGDEVAGLVDRLVGRLGETNVHGLAPVDSHLPERAQRRRAPLKTAKKDVWRTAHRRPARLLDRPEPLQDTLALLPDHPPARFRWRGRTHRVVRADPAERIADEWWREQKPTRDYFRVEDEDGRRFWLRRDGLTEDGETPSWSLHGLFA
jgi:protein ImuB